MSKNYGGGPLGRVDREGGLTVTAGKGIYSEKQIPIAAVTVSPTLRVSRRYGTPLLILLLASVVSAAKYPQLLRLQGRFTDTRIPLTDNLPVRFTIWDSEDGYGNLLWEDVQNVTIQENTFQVVLGKNRPLTPSVFTGGDRWVELQIGSDAPMRPRHWIPNKYLQTQVATEQAEEERRALEVQIEKYRETVRPPPPAPVPPPPAPIPPPVAVPAPPPVVAPVPEPVRPPKPKPAVRKPVSDDSGVQGPVYEVQGGDTLKSIAQKLYGNAELWYDLYYLNRDRLGPMGHLFTGQILVLPTKTPGERTR